MDAEIEAVLEAFKREGAREAELITGMLRRLARNAELRRQFLDSMSALINSTGAAVQGGSEGLAAQIEEARRRLPGALP